MSEHILKIVATGRRWGDGREPEKRDLNVAGVRLHVVEMDSWEGPLNSGEEGEYSRVTAISLPDRYRDDRLAWSAGQ